MLSDKATHGSIQRHAEPLEPRTLLSASVGLDDEGVLRITGTPGRDTIILRLTDDDQRLEVRVNRATHFIAAEGLAALRRIVIDAGAGHDQVSLFEAGRLALGPPTHAPDVPVLVSGGAGNDRIEGSITDDTFRGGPGRDTLGGGQGADRLFGGAGDDLLSAGNVFGNFLQVTAAPDDQEDLLDGGSGDDQAFAGADDRTRGFELPDNPSHVFTLTGTLRLDIGFEIGIGLDLGPGVNDRILLDLSAVDDELSSPITPGGVRVTGYFHHFVGHDGRYWGRIFKVGSLTYT